jgi:hypothetical protein
MNPLATLPTLPSSIDPAAKPAPLRAVAARLFISPQAPLHVPGGSFFLGSALCLVALCWPPARQAGSAAHLAGRYRGNRGRRNPRPERARPDARRETRRSSLAPRTRCTPLGGRQGLCREHVPVAGPQRLQLARADDSGAEHGIGKRGHVVREAQQDAAHDPSL